MKHDYVPRESARQVGVPGTVVVEPRCSCNWKGPPKDGWTPKDNYDTRQRAKKIWQNHVTLERQKKRYQNKRMELAGVDHTKEVWIANLHGDLPPEYKYTKYDSMQGPLYSAWYRSKTHTYLSNQVDTGKLYPWLVFVRLNNPARFTYKGAFATREKALVSARRKLSMDGKVGVTSTTYTPRVPSFEQYLRRLSVEVERANSVDDRARMIKKMRKINAAFELVQQAYLDMLKDMAGQ